MKNHNILQEFSWNSYRSSIPDGFGIHLVSLIDLVQLRLCYTMYSHLSNNRGGWNKRGGRAKVAKSINVEVGINVEGGIFWKKLVHKCNKRGVEGGKI